MANDLEEAIFIDGTKIEANVKKFTLVWKKSIERESSEELASEELVKVVEKSNGVVKEYDSRIASSEDVAERKFLRFQRKLSKQY